MQNNRFIATNGAAASGFGQSSAGAQTSTGVIANNLFSGERGGTGPTQSLWFVNLQGIPEIDFEGNEFVSGVANHIINWSYFIWS